MRGLDRVAQPRAAHGGLRGDGVAAAPATAPSPARRGRLAAAGERVVSARDLLYPSRARAEAEFWTRTDFAGGFFGLARPGSGDALERDDQPGLHRRSGALVDRRSHRPRPLRRRPRRSAATTGGYERYWITRGGSDRLDVYELSAGVIRKVRAGLGLGWAATYGPRRRVRFIRADLNFARLPENRYDVIWSSGCLHHIIELEHLFAEVERALRPGGLFAIRDYVGERRMQFAPDRLARINAVLQEVPARYRRAEALAADAAPSLSPFCGVRSDAILPLAEARFEVVHKAPTGALVPAHLRHRPRRHRARGAGRPGAAAVGRAGGAARSRRAPVRRLRGVPQATVKFRRVGTRHAVSLPCPWQPSRFSQRGGDAVAPALVHDAVRVRHLAGNHLVDARLLVAVDDVDAVLAGVGRVGLAGGCRHAQEDQREVDPGGTAQIRHLLDQQFGDRSGHRLAPGGATLYQRVLDQRDRGQVLVQAATTDTPRADGARARRLVSAWRTGWQRC